MSVTSETTAYGVGGPTSRQRDDLTATFAIDSRALMVARILMAALILVESLVFELDRPRNPDGPFEFFAEYGDVLVIPFALMLLVGFKTRFAIVLCWLAYSIRVRGDLVSSEVAVSIGDIILSVLLFWSMFLPLGRHLSLDSRGRSEVPVRYLSVASAGLLLQIFAIYLISGFYKSLDEWVIDATALETILSHPIYETPLGVELLGFPTLLAVLSVATVVLEILGAILVILPGRSLATRRMVIVPLFIALHVGIAAVMGLELFPYVLMVAWLVFLPSRFWDWLWRRVRGSTPTAVPMTDPSRWRNLVAGAGFAVVVISNLITILYFPEVEGAAAGFQQVAKNLVLYQQWAMFSVPSSLP